MLVRHRARQPDVHASAFVAPTDVLIGDVRVGPRCRILYGAVIDSEGSMVEIDATTIVNENAVIRATSIGGRDHPVVVAIPPSNRPRATPRPGEPARSRRR